MRSGSVCAEMLHSSLICYSASLSCRCLVLTGGVYLHLSHSIVNDLWKNGETHQEVIFVQNLWLKVLSCTVLVIHLSRSLKNSVQFSTQLEEFYSDVFPHLGRVLPNYRTWAGWICFLAALFILDPCRMGCKTENKPRADNRAWIPNLQWTSVLWKRDL